MDPEIKTIAKETFDKLPQDVKEVIFADDCKRILDEIGDKYNLIKEQRDNLAIQTISVLMGVEKRGYFPFNLENELNLDEDTAENINKDITDTIFAEVWRSLDDMDKKEVGTPEQLKAKMEYDEKKEDEEEADEGESTNIDSTENILEITKPVPAVALSSLSDRLKQASIAAPAKRDYTLDKNPMSGPLAGSDDSSTANIPSEAPRAIDPYHESIDNE